MNIKEGFDESLAIWFVVEIQQKFDCSRVDKFTVDTVWQLSKKTVKLTFTEDFKFLRNF